MKNILFIVSLATVLQGYSQYNSGGKMTLKQCVETGIANNQQVFQADIQAQMDELNWKQAKLNRLPGLNAVANHGINQGRSIDPSTNTYINEQVNFAGYGLSSGVVLFNGFSMQNIVKQNKFSYQASNMDWQQAKDNLTINIILAYLQVLSNEDVLVQFRNQLELSKKQVDRLTILDKEGAIAPFLLSDLKGQYANDQLSIINARNALEISKLALCQLMNVAYDKDITLERLDTVSSITSYGETTATIYNTALQQFSLVKAVDLRKLSAEKGLKVARGRLFPTLSLNGNINSNYSNALRAALFLNTSDVVSTDYVIVNGNPAPVVYKQNNYRFDRIDFGSQLKNNFFSTVSLNLRIPLFNSLQARNQVKMAQLTVKNTDIVAKTTRIQLQQNIEQAYINMNTASDRYRTLLEQVESFAESFRAAEIRFNAGVGNSIDYLTAKNNLERANVNLLNAKYDFVLRTKVLDYYQGKQLW